MTNVAKDIKLQIKKLFFKEQKKSEIKIAYIRFFISLIYLAGIIGLRNEVPVHSVYTVIVVSILSVLFSIGVLLYIKFFDYNDKIKYITSFFDIILITITLNAFGTFRTFKTEAFLVYFLWIILAAMRLSAKVTLFTGVLAVISYIGLIVLALVQSTIHTGSVTEHFTSEKVSMLNQYLRILFMSSLFIVAAYIAKIYERLSRETVQKEYDKQKEMQEKQQVKNALSRYVTVQVADKILSQEISMKGEKKEATVLFCDIRNFTKMSDSLPAEEVVSFLNEYFSIMVDIIFKYNGTLDKFIGDEIMAVFGVPFSSDRDAENAIYAAWEMTKALDKLNDERLKNNKVKIDVGIGIHSGDVIAGNIGSQKRMDYTVIGTTVNIASRVEALNKKLKTKILVTESTYDKIKNLISTKRQPLVRVKGIERPLQTYEVLELNV